MLKSSSIICLVFLVFIIFSSTALADNYTVSTDGTGDFTAIQDAINAADNNDVITVNQGRYYENITMKDGVIIVGAGADVCTINGNGSGSVITYNTGGMAQIKNFTITNGYASNGGGIYVDNSSRLLIYNCTITGNVATLGGGIYNTNTSIVNINNCNVTNNRACNGGAVYNGYYSYTTYQYSTVSGNSPTQIVGFSQAHDYGGNTFGDPIWYVDDNLPANFTSIQSAIDASADGGTVIVMPGTYVENLDISGKAITLQSTGAVTSTIIRGDFNGSVIKCTTGESSGTIIKGFFITKGSGTYDEGSDTYRGGGIYNDNSSLTITNCIITNCNATYGGAIANITASAQITNCTFRNNQATASGGAIYTDGNDVNVNNCIFAENTASTAGGGIYNANTTASAVSNSTFDLNSATDGGAIYNTLGTINIQTSILSNNTATNGGGVCNYIGTTSHAIMYFYDSTANYNTADIGGGTYNSSRGQLFLKNMTLCSNTVNNIYGPYVFEGGNLFLNYCPSPKPAVSYQTGDLDEDFDIDLDDLVIFAQNWLTGAD